MPSKRVPAPDAHLRPLNIRQKRFVDQILAGIAPGEAATRAGYSFWSTAQSAYELTRRPNVAAAIAAGRRASGGGLTREAAIAELAAVAMSNILDYSHVHGPDLNLDLSRLDRARAAGVRELIIEDRSNDKTGDRWRITRLRMGPKLAALRSLIPLLPTAAELAAEAAGQGPGQGEALTAPGEVPDGARATA